MNEKTSLMGASPNYEALMQEMQITDAEIAQRKAWLQFTTEDVERVQMISDFSRRIQDEVIDELYDHFMSFEETRQFFSDSQLLDRVKALQKDYFIRLTLGNFDRENF